MALFFCQGWWAGVGLDRSPSGVSTEALEVSSDSTRKREGQATRWFDPNGPSGTVHCAGLLSAPPFFQTKHWSEPTESRWPEQPRPGDLPVSGAPNQEVEMLGRSVGILALSSAVLVSMVVPSALKAASPGTQEAVSEALVQ